MELLVGFTQIFFVSTFIFLALKSMASKSDALSPFTFIFWIDYYSLFLLALIYFICCNFLITKFLLINILSFVMLFTFVNNALEILYSTPLNFYSLCILATGPNMLFEEMNDIEYFFKKESFHLHLLLGILLFLFLPYYNHSNSIFISFIIILFCLSEWIKINTSLLRAVFIFSFFALLFYYITYQIVLQYLEIEFCIELFVLYLLFIVFNKEEYNRSGRNKRKLFQFVLNTSLKPANNISLEQAISIIKTPLTPIKNIKPNHELHNPLILLITAESFSKYYIDYYNRGTAKLFFFESLTKMPRILSNRHYSISPNTRNALTIMLTQKYDVHQVSQSKLAQAKEAGYRCISLHHESLRHLNAGKSLVNFGFDTIIGQEHLPDCHYDEEFFLKSLNMLEKQGLIQDKLFIHLINKQSHTPYYSKKGAKDRLGRYILSCEEADLAFLSFYDRLRNLLGHDNILIIYTGDHGQGFGEMGYRTHSNSITKQIIEVPLLISHKKINDLTIPISTHFDILPTIYSLLNLPLQKSENGWPLIHNYNPYNFLLYSEIRYCNSPACFGLILREHNKKIFIDRAHKMFYAMTLEDEIIYELSKEEIKYYEGVCYQLFKQNNLIF